MREKKTLDEVIEIARAEMESAHVRRAVVSAHAHPHSAYMRVRRAFGVEGAIDVYIRIERGERDGALRMYPVVNLNFPASNKSVIETVAFMHLVNELTPLAASLQVQLDEYEIVEEKGSRPAPVVKAPPVPKLPGDDHAVSLLTEGQRAALAYVTSMYDEGHPAFNVDDKHGARELTLSERHKLEAMRLIERFDYQSEYRVKHPNSACPPFIYFRPTQLGRDYVSDQSNAASDARHAARLDRDLQQKKASS